MKNIHLLIGVTFLMLGACGLHPEGPCTPTGAENPVDSPTPRPTAAPTTSYIFITSPQYETSFVSTDMINLIAMIINEDFKKNNIVTWFITGHLGSIYSTEVEATNTLIGKEHTFNFNPTLALLGRGDKLLYEFYVQLNSSGVNSFDVINLKQDDIDQCRQEYIDMIRNYIPIRDDLINSKGSDHFSLYELSWTSHYTDCHTSEVRATYIKCILTNGLEATRNNLENTMGVSSGYRNPMKQAEVSAGTTEGLHQYGQAVDIYTKDYDKDGDIDGADWDHLRNAAKDAGACVEPYRITNTWSYVHMDWGRSSCPKDDW